WPSGFPKDSRNRPVCRLDGANATRTPVRLQSSGPWPTMTSAMEFGVSLPSRGPLAHPDVVLKIAAKAEALRYASVFVSDHIVLPVSTARSIYPYSPTRQLPGGANQDYLEPLALLAHLAHATTKVRLGTSVLVVPYRSPETP